MLSWIEKRINYLRKKQLLIPSINAQSLRQWISVIQALRVEFLRLAISHLRPFDLERSGTSHWILLEFLQTTYTVDRAKTVFFEMNLSGRSQGHSHRTKTPFDAGIHENASKRPHRNQTPVRYNPGPNWYPAVPIIHQKTRYVARSHSFCFITAALTIMISLVRNHIHTELQRREVNERLENSLKI